MTATLVVLARVPLPGEGKTRLRRLLAAATVDAIAAAMVADTLAWSANAEGFDRVLVAHRGAPGLLLRSAAPQAQWVEQAEGDLGARIDAALDKALEAGGVAVQIGTDSPTLPRGLLDSTLEALDSAPAALVPADDGGWIALGITRPLRGALLGVPWSNRATGRRTIEALRRAGLPPRVLASHYDIDEPSDLLRLAADPGACQRAPRTLAAVRPLLAGLLRAEAAAPAPDRTP
ncbi:MAG: DUF2064 domain-containing protein [Candidatus Dormibacteria bacterium]